ncbi:MAG: 30S ribosome-binding factor RbfA [Gammaproteobacteria bacterium]|nr:MAG: 30S ribosome-binding factor RbfA [Gammaproteobacteria bacterium]
MPREFNRTQRLGAQLKRDLSELIRTEIRDLPSILTVSEVRVTKDLSQARVFISMLEEDKDRVKTCIATLNDFAALLRWRLGRRMRIRAVPGLSFVHDNSYSRGVELTNLIERAVAEDQVHACDRGEDDAGHGDDTTAEDA